MNATVDSLLNLLRRIEACPDVMFTIDSNDSDLASEIMETIEKESD